MIKKQIQIIIPNNVSHLRNRDSIHKSKYMTANMTRAAHTAIMKAR